MCMDIFSISNTSILLLPHSFSLYLQERSQQHQQRFLQQPSSDTIPPPSATPPEATPPSATPPNGGRGEDGLGNLPEAWG